MSHSFRHVTNFAKIIDAARNTVLFLATGYCRQNGINPTDVVTIVMKYIGCKLNVHIVGETAEKYCSFHNSLAINKKNNKYIEVNKINGNKIIQSEPLSNFLNNLINISSFDASFDSNKSIKSIESIQFMDNRYLISIIANNEIYFTRLCNTNSKYRRGIHKESSLFFLGNTSNSTKNVTNLSDIRNISDKLKTNVIKTNIMNDIRNNIKKMYNNDDDNNNIKIINIQLSRSKQTTLTNMFVICNLSNN